MQPPLVTRFKHGRSPLAHCEVAAQDFSVVAGQSALPLLLRLSLATDADGLCCMQAVAALCLSDVPSSNRFHVAHPHICVVANCCSEALDYTKILTFLVPISCSLLIYCYVCENRINVVVGFGHFRF